MQISNSTVAWVCLAIMMAGDVGESVDKQAVIRAGDYINKAIITDEEYAFALSRLNQLGYLRVDGNKIFLTKSTISLYETLQKKTTDLMQQINILKLTLEENA